METTQMDAPPGRPYSWLGVVLHTLVVLSLSTTFLIIAPAANPNDTNIGGGFVWVSLCLLGLPWSIPTLNDGWDGLLDLVAVGAAFANLALHTSFMWRANKPRGPSQRST